MTWRVKNWNKFQHYKHRDPPWIRLYRGLLNDREWHELEPDAAKALINIWLIASEREGCLPEPRDLAFRLRVTEKHIISILSKLSHWLEQDASTVLAESEQHAPPETETETETEQSRIDPSLRSDVIEKVSCETWPEDFRERFWQQYPRKIARKAAITILERIKKQGDVSFVVLMAGVSKIPTNEPRFIPHPTTWLNQGRWEDEVLPLNGASNGKASSSQRAYAHAERLRELERAAGVGRSPVDVGRG